MLTDVQCKAAKPKDKNYKLTDSHGLYLFVTRTGYKSWRWKYRIGATEKRLVLGPYPEISLLNARELRAAADRIRRAGTDPADDPSIRPQASSPPASIYTFSAAAADWHAKMKPVWSAKHAGNVWRWLENDAIGVVSTAVPPSWPGQFGDLEMDSITAPMVHELLKRIEARGAVDQAHRMRQRLTEIFGTAMAAGLAQRDPATPVGKALTRNRSRHYPAFVRIESARAALQLTEAEPGHPIPKLASRLIALTASRSGPLRHMAWVELEGLDGPEPIWRVPPEKMKLGLDEKEDQVFEFIVPLAPQSVATIAAARRISGSGPLVFPSVRFADRPISDSTISVMYRRHPKIAGKHVPHGWRTSFSTIMNERAGKQNLRGDREIIDLMLAHRQQGVEPIYNRAAYMDRRREIACEWADLLLQGLAPPDSLLNGPRHR